MYLPGHPAVRGAALWLITATRSFYHFFRSSGSVIPRNVVRGGFRPSSPMKRVITPSFRSLLVTRATDLSFIPPLGSIVWTSTLTYAALEMPACIVFPTTRVTICTRMADFKQILFLGWALITREIPIFVCLRRENSARTLRTTRYRSASEWADKIISQQIATPLLFLFPSFPTLEIRPKYICRIFFTPLSPLCPALGTENLIATLQCRILHWNVSKILFKYKYKRDLNNVATIFKNFLNKLQFFSANIWICVRVLLMKLY